MNEEEAAGRANRFSQVLNRFSRLAPSGMQCFIGRFIANGTDKSAVREEVERALERLETEQDLKEKCWSTKESKAEEGGHAEPVRS
jgi:hypothetical protein